MVHIEIFVLLACHLPLEAAMKLTSCSRGDPKATSRSYGRSCPRAILPKEFGYFTKGARDINNDMLMGSRACLSAMHKSV